MHTTKQKACALLAGLLLTGVFTGCAKQPAAPDSDVGSQAGTSASTSVQSGLWEQSIQTLSISGDTVTGDAFSENTLTVFNVWGTWCPPCVGELPHLQSVSQTYADQGVQVVGLLQDGVAQDGSPDTTIIENATMLLEEAGANYLVVLPDQALFDAFLKGTQSFPTTFFVDQSGQVVKTVVGAKDTQEWEGIFDEVLTDLDA